MSTLLDQIAGPTELRTLTAAQRQTLAREVRERIISVVSRSGGHLASNLGAVELTLALHTAFDFSRDRLLWDVGHQCYVHKLLTGRGEGFGRLRRRGGVSGFPSPVESDCDVFSVGHAGTAVPTAVGLAIGERAAGRDTRIVSVVGDASIVNGLAFEGVNQAGLLHRQFLIVLNDNSMGIAPTQGGFAEHLSRLRLSGFYDDFKRRTKVFLNRMPVLGTPMLDALGTVRKSVLATVSQHRIFEALGLAYFGPVDGHDIEHLVELFKALRDYDRPAILHVHTEKGRGCAWAMQDPCRFHSPAPFEIRDSGEVVIKRKGTSFTEAFADALVEAGRADERVWALTAAMPDGTGLARFAEAYPRRFRDCGIAESGTVDVAAGLARTGLRPVVAIYSTFMQRAFDQIFHDVVLQGLPVVFALDRAGLVGGDGAVHHGFCDIAYLRPLPQMVLMAPADREELHAALALAMRLDVPSALRYPRDVVPRPLPGACEAFEPGRCRPLRDGSDATILTYGSPATAALSAAKQLAGEGIEVAVVNARFAKPIDRDMVRAAVAAGGPVLTVEDHSVVGGFGAAVLEVAAEMGLSAERVVRLGIPSERFVGYGSRTEQLAEVGLDADGIAASVRRAVETARHESLLGASRGGD